ncbi:hypothetical protein GYMLUDRAFT_45898 [Collybiopsis luxurians FD-317 M1]|uniref:Chromo domain-containing protein n=1 Tax=Collybiopsis luxurians FD-317 M1 TaxID=944289 RepID=A0A0D0CQK2_9AGAR|nr:hypothetical protein GYMLUDRAFT_45898 [Collybiopsis luxurians FD-317 M1]
MSDSEEEYIVESVVAARVKKGKVKAWEYRVRWKGYTEEDDTWEPVKHFEGSKHFVDSFWARASRLLGGRNVDDLSLFKTGEQFFPVGPPLKKKKSQATITESFPVASSSNQTQTSKHRNKRTRNSTPDSPASPEQPSSKRVRISANSRPETPSTSTRKSTKPVTTAAPPTRLSARKPRKEPSVVPPSEDEDDDEIQIIEPPVASKDPPRSSRRSTGNVGKSSAVRDPADAPNTANRERPRTRMDDSFQNGVLEGAVGNKTRLSGKGKEVEPSESSTSNIKRRKPGPGRSSEGLRKSGKNTTSLLTFEKGQPKTVKVKFVSSEAKREEKVAESTEDVPMAVDDSPLFPPSPPAEPPTASELLQLASRGGDNGEDLENFEEGENVHEPTPEPEPTTAPAVDGSSSLIQRSLSLAKESLFPSAWSPAALVPSAWKRPTIFGPLGLASDSRSSPGVTTTTGTNSDEAQISPFTIILDVSSKLPVVLTAVSSTDAPILEKAVRNVSRGPPGKFYSNEAALAMLDTLRTGGGSAKVITAPNALESETRDFEKFRERLGNNELFVFMAGIDLLVFCSSNSSLIAQRLNLPASLLSEPDSVLVGRVNIANHTAYANAALQVDSVPW